MNAASEPQERRFEEALEGLLERGAPGWFRRRAAAAGVPEMPGDTIGPYRLLEELGRGGQAVVFLAEDVRLHRQVALKVFQNVPGGDPARLLRFAREAEVASKLDHPGICTIYESGTEGLIAWTAMQYVEGESLAARLGRQRGGGSSAATSAGEIEGPGTSEARDEAVSTPITTGHLQRAEILEAVEIMEKVARALHAAHEAGVLHRDVKPANIMISKAGEPLLMDFGLARQEDTELPTLTRTGDLFGTPAYMSPEQLTRQSIRVDRRTDVWSLGVTLYECLARQRPFEEPTREALYQAILTKEPPDLRKLSPAVPRDLRTVLQTALEKDRDRRYQSALALAEDLRRVREQLPIEARPISALGRLIRWARRRPARAALAACLMIGIPILTGLGTWIVAHRGEVARQQRADLESRVERLVAEGLLELEQGSLSRARECFETARVLLPEWGEATGGLAMVHLREGDPEAAIAAIHAASVHDPGFAILEAEALTRLGREKEVRELTDGLPEPAAPLGYFLAGHKALSDGRATGKETPQGAAAFRRAQDAFERAIFLSQRARLVYYVSLAQAVHEVESAAGIHPAVVALESLWPRSLLAHVWSGHALRARGRLDDAIAAYRGAVALDPESAWAQYNLGAALATKGKDDAAIAAYEKAIALDPSNPQPHCNIAKIHRARGDLDKAVAALRRSVAVDPHFAEGHYDLGHVLDDQGHLEEAVAAYHKAIAINPRYVLALNNLGITLDVMGRPEEAMTWLGRALEVDPAYAPSHYNMGNVHRSQGRLAEAIAAYEKATTIDPRFEDAFHNLGLARMEAGDHEGAVAAYRKAIDIDPEDARSYYGLGNAYRVHGDIAEAITAYEKALGIAPDFAEAQCNLGVALEARGDFEGALAAYLKAIEIDPEHAQIHYTLGNAYRTGGDMEEAISAYEKALEIAPDHAEAYCNLGLALLASGDFEQAVKRLREGDRLGRSRPEAWPYDSKHWIVHALGAWFRDLYDKAEFARAREVLLQAVEVLPEDPDLLNWVARVLVDPEHDPRLWDGEAALALATKAVALTRREKADFLDTLAWARLRSGDVPGAIAVQEEVLEKLASGGGAAERMAKARDQMAHFRKVLEGAPR